MDKFGYVPEEKDPKVKEASEKAICPICGQALVGTPPICPTHGSEPFEKRSHGQG